MKKIISIIVVMLFAVTSYAQNKGYSSIIVDAPLLNKHGFKVNKNDMLTYIRDSVSVKKPNIWGGTSADQEYYEAIQADVVSVLTQEELNILGRGFLNITFNPKGEIVHIIFHMRNDVYDKISQETFCRLLTHVKTIKFDMSKFTLIELYSKDKTLQYEYSGFGFTLVRQYK